jgi:hypothetical protein
LTISSASTRPRSSTDRGTAHRRLWSNLRDGRYHAPGELFEDQPDIARALAQRGDTCAIARQRRQETLRGRYRLLSSFCHAVEEKPSQPSQSPATRTASRRS